MSAKIPIPANAVQGGQEGSEKLFIGKMHHNGIELLGKVTSSGKLYCSYQGNELCFESDFALLVVLWKFIKIKL